MLRRLGDDDLETLLAAPRPHSAAELPLTADARAALRAMADGDGRFLLNLVEEIARLPAERLLDPAELAPARAAARAALRQGRRKAITT